MAETHGGSGTNASVVTEQVPGLGRIDRNRFAGSSNTLAGWRQKPF